MLMQVDTPIGNTLPDMAITVVICLACELVARGIHNAQKREII
jgi:hypothetical protein